MSAVSQLVACFECDEGTRLCLPGQGTNGSNLYLFANPL